MHLFKSQDIIIIILCPACLIPPQFSYWAFQQEKDQSRDIISTLLQKKNYPLFSVSFSVVELECCHRKTQNPKSMLAE